MRNKASCFSDPNDFVSCPGERMKQLYASKVLEDGTIELIPSEKIDIREEINSYRDSTDMSFILKQIELGNTSVLSAKKPFYGDFTTAPSSMAQMLQLGIDARKQFDSLPVELKQKFDNDFNQFFVTAGSKEWFDIVSPFIVDPVRVSGDQSVDQSADQSGDLQRE